jgi:hypothetical protein
MEQTRSVDHRPAGLIRRTLLSVLKLPRVLRNPSQPLLSLESESQMTGSVVLTKLDGGGSYHSAGNGENDPQASLLIL